MLPLENERLKQQYSDQYVMVREDSADLARFEGLVGQVKTVNQNGRALVQFDGFSNRGWYDIALDRLRIVDKPAPTVMEKAAPKAPAKPAAVPAANPET
jgi:hypothetical protein